jgi:hypothetical protein
MTGAPPGQFVRVPLPAFRSCAITRSVALVPTLIVALVYAGTTEMQFRTRRSTWCRSPPPFAPSALTSRAVRDISACGAVHKTTAHHLWRAVAAPHPEAAR